MTPLKRKPGPRQREPEHLAPDLGPQRQRPALPRSEHHRHGDKDDA
jgi:hypothetical protein